MTQKKKSRLKKVSRVLLTEYERLKKKKNGPFREHGQSELFSLKKLYMSSSMGKLQKKKKKGLFILTVHSFKSLPFVQILLAQHQEYKMQVIQVTCCVSLTLHVCGKGT